MYRGRGRCGYHFGEIIEVHDRPGLYNLTHLTFNTVDCVAFRHGYTSVGPLGLA